MATTCKALLITRMVTALTAACITDLDADDNTRAGLVAAGKYEGQQDLDRIIILPMDNHPAEDVRWMDEMKDYESDLGFKLPADGKGIIGGKQWNVLRGTVKVIVNLSRGSFTGAEEIEIRQTVLSRIKSTLQQSAQMRGFTDDFGEMVQFFKIARQPEYDQVDDCYEAYVDWAALTLMPR